MIVVTLKRLIESSHARIRTVWRGLRAVTGDDAYDRYVAHQERAHPGEPLLTRRAYYAERQRQKWSGITRCC